MKISIAILALSTTACLYAADDYQLETPIGEAELIANEEQQGIDETLKELIKELETNDMFAGKLSQVTFRRKVYTVNRQNEALKIPTGNAPRAPRIGLLLNDLGLKADGHISIRVTRREFTDDGKLKTEDVWEVSFGGAWEAQTGMADAMGKQHK